MRPLTFVARSRSMIRSVARLSAQLSTPLHVIVLAAVWALLVFVTLPLWFKFPIVALHALFAAPNPAVFSIINAGSPVILWLFLFVNAGHIPIEIRPPISTNILPTLDTYIFGINIVPDVLSRHTHPVFDLLAFVPYGIVHYVAPILFLIYLSTRQPGSVIAVFAQSFGAMCAMGVITQLIFPNAPPWYELLPPPIPPPSYDMPGNPAGLARVDHLFGTNFYKNTFGSSPIVFGAFPSLHSGFACIIAMFLGFLLPRRAVFIGSGIYVLWLWWATMYLQHHYFIDVLGGLGYAGASFWWGRGKMIGHKLKEAHLTMTDDGYRLISVNVDNKQSQGGLESEILFDSSRMPSPPPSP